MDWIVISWSVMAAACLTLGSIHLLVWINERNDKAHLAFSIAAASIALVGVFEILLMHAASAAEYAVLLRWAHVPFALLVPMLVAFVRIHLGAGRSWLGHLAWSLRALTLIPDFTTGVNLNFLSMSHLIQRETWGATFQVPVGDPNPWMILGQLSSYVLLAFFVDAVVTEWRKPRDVSDARVIRICSSLALFVLLAASWHLAVVAGLLHFPIAILPAFTGVVVVMSYELGGDVIRAARLAKALTASQATLRHSEQRIEDAVLAAGLGLWEWNLGTNEFWLSPRARELLGVEAAGPVDRGQLRERIDPSDLEALDAAIGPLLTKADEYHSEFRINHADGQQLWLRGRGQGEFDAQGKLVLIRGVLVNITEQKLAAVQRDELAHLSRVAVFAELSGSLAHELNQPLMSILSNAQAALRFMAHDPPNLGEVNECLTNVVEGDKRAGEVIRRLRAMLRKDAAEFRRIDLNEIVHEVLRILRSDLLSKSVSVQLDLQAGLPASEGDVIQLQQVLLNLILNGSDAMSEGVRDKELTIRTRTSAEGEVELSVADRGCGIPEADLSRIFSPFVTTKQEGMGLGLAVCATIIESHRGRIWAVNNSNGGASVHFRLPASGPDLAVGQPPPYQRLF